MVNETPKGETRQSALTATARPAVSRSVKGVNLQWRPDQLWTELHGRLSSGRMPDANGPNVPRLRRTLLVDETSLVLDRVLEVVTGNSGWSRLSPAKPTPFHLRAGSPSIGCDDLSEKGALRRLQTFWPSPRNGEVRPHNCRSPHRAPTKPNGLRCPTSFNLTHRL